MTVEHMIFGHMTVEHNANRAESVKRFEITEMTVEHSESWT